MVILEAWSYGKPVVMTQMCNLPEGFTAGAAIQIGADVQSISEGLQKLAGSSTQELETMGARGLDLVKAKFTWPSIGEEMRRVNQWLISGGEAPESVNLFKN
jgi:poly(glycerol-phosphate) alpha-glucosyltransferase